MPVAVVADAHLGGPGGGPEPLLAQLRELPDRGCDHLVVLGDLFQAWVGFPHFETPAIRAVVDGLLELRGQGIPIDYVEGNRDFYLAGSVYRAAFDTLAGEVRFTSGATRYLAVHGDGLDDADRQYRLWRAISKSAPMRWALRAIPGPLARRFVHSTERRLADTNFKHKKRIPREVIERYGVRRLAEGHDCLLLGHFHEPRRWPVSGGEVRILEAWFTSRRVEWF